MIVVALFVVAAILVALFVVIVLLLFAVVALCLSSSAPVCQSEASNSFHICIRLPLSPFPSLAVGICRAEC